MSYIPSIEVSGMDFGGRYNGIRAKTIVTAMPNKMHTAHMQATNA